MNGKNVRSTPLQG